MSRRFWIGWAVGAAVVVGGYGAYWWTHPTTAPASGAPGRVGFVAVPLLIPLLLAALRGRKLEFDSAGAVALPIVASAAVLLIALAAGFLPEHFQDCSVLHANGYTDPSCNTTQPTREEAFGEAVASWAWFAAVAGMIELWARRARRRMAEARSSK